MRILQNGSSGYDVALWQHFLTARGFLPPGGIDGDFGTHTAAATKAFQLQQDLADNGSVGSDMASAAAQQGFVVPRGPNEFSDEVLGIGSRERLCTLHPHLADLIVELARRTKADHNIISVIFSPSAFRSFAQQRKLIEQDRTRPGPIVHIAGPGESYHNYGLATDVHTLSGGVINPNDRDEARKRGVIGRTIGLEWGGDFTAFVDLPHFQLTKGLSIKACLELYKQGGIIAVGNEVTRRMGARAILERGDEVE